MPLLFRCPCPNFPASFFVERNRFRPENRRSRSRLVVSYSFPGVFRKREERSVIFRFRCPGMYKNQLQELAQRSCFNLPSYSCLREGPDHAPRFKSTVNFNGEIFESPNYCTTLRQAEHSAAEVALNALSKKGPSRLLASRVLDETGVYKNLLQETAHRAGLDLPVYTTVRSGPGHVPLFLSTVELAGMTFSGDPGKSKKQAQKNAAMAAWTALKQMSQSGPYSSLSSECEVSEEQEQVTIARLLAGLSLTIQQKTPVQHERQQKSQDPNMHRREIPQSCIMSTAYPILPYQNWSPCDFSTDISMYHSWNQQHNLFAVSPPPQLLPYIQASYHANHGLSSPTRMVMGVSSSFSPPFLSLEPLPMQVRTSGCHMHELQEENRREKREWPHQVLMPNSRIDSSNLNSNHRSDTPNLRPFKSQMPRASVKSNVKIQEVEEEKQKGRGSGVERESKCENSESSHQNSCISQIHEGKETEHLCVQGGSLGASATEIRNRPVVRESRLRPIAPSSMHFQGQSMRRFSHSHVANFMAPAVQIRSVIPVCSAPPERRSPEPNDMCSTEYDPKK
ncbi:double-stranded RNA-binding protein 2 isoform X2 [Amborella trichopoda]|uniref:double-stranded RNA-binding protein 2 isoform X2 n=1 Tax=Amborella trichopoda TaxID=13333 RepID=UPI0009BEB15A|nr:double-stranded RNA-binding protein 2 isoform X2 [Amborella trichopoda]|eukprot:XP_020529813.1 double-stranded RNA-binding protein 2 isoform X2 [Amborella trichopoda]